MILAITDIMRGHDALENYLEWVRRGAPGVESRILSVATSPREYLLACDGLLLTGGGDVHPKFYGREDALPVVKEVRVERDEFEFLLIREALVAQMPILGICRGCQVFNVALGGSLVPDLLSLGINSHRNGAGGKQTHPLQLVPGTGLHSLLGSDNGVVNTSHHQSVERPGKGLRVTASAPDGVIEGLEWEDPVGKPWIQMIQWHPERAWGESHSFSREILKAFIGAMEDRGVNEGKRN
jgi:putative glutamine amidotransferase